MKAIGDWETEDYGGVNRKHRVQRRFTMTQKPNKMSLYLIHRMTQSPLSCNGVRTLIGQFFDMVAPRMCTIRCRGMSCYCSLDFDLRACHHFFHPTHFDAYGMLLKQGQNRNAGANQVAVIRKKKGMFDLIYIDYYILRRDIGSQVIHYNQN